MDLLTRLFEHNRWGNLEIIKGCSTLETEILEKSLAPGKMTIRELLPHIVGSEVFYLSELGKTVSPLPENPSFDELSITAEATGKGLLEVAQSFTEAQLAERKEIRDYHVQPWVLLAQAMNHGAEHRKDIRMIMLANGIEPPRVDGWAAGASVGAVGKLK